MLVMQIMLCSIFKQKWFLLLVSFFASYMDATLLVNSSVNGRISCNGSHMGILARIAMFGRMPINNSTFE